MLIIDNLAEERIQAALRDGEFDDLPGQGGPLELEDDRAVPPELRVAYRMLRNAGCLPRELLLRREIGEVEGLLRQVEIDGETASLRRRLCLLRARLAAHGHESNLLLQEGDYRERILRRLGAGDDL